MKMQHLVILFALGAVVGCSKPEGQAKPEADKAPTTQQTTAPAATTAAAAAGGNAAQDLFTSRCSICHGTSGKGDGPGAAALNPKPRDYTNKDWQASMTDERLKKVIVGGGASVGKSAAMPPNPDLEGKPELDGLVSIVRSFGK